MALTIVLSSGTEGLRMTALEVGHGDALVVQTPDGRVALVDTGGHRGGQGNAYLAERTLTPALTRLGHHRLDALVLTHADLDHVGAAAHLASRLEIAEVWLPPCALRDPALSTALAPVRARGGRVRVWREGVTETWGGVRWVALWPGQGAGCEAGKNETGLVLRLDYAGRRLLLAADVGHETEEVLLERGDALSADLLKVGHHGSRGSTSAAFLRAVSPQWAVVSGRFVGGRMPPHQQVLTRLCQAGARLWITGRDGAVMARVSPEGQLEVGAWAR